MSSHCELSPGYLIRFETLNIKAVDRARQIKKPIGEGIGVVASPSKPPAKPIAPKNKTNETMPLVRCQRFQFVTLIVRLPISLFSPQKFVVPLLLKTYIFFQQNQWGKGALFFQSFLATETI